MNDATYDNHDNDSDHGKDLPETDAPTPQADRAEEANGDNELGMFATFVRNQPLLTLSLAFGLGLIATSLLARRTS